MTQPIINKKANEFKTFGVAIIIAIPIAVIVIG